MLVALLKFIKLCIQVSLFMNNFAFYGHENDVKNVLVYSSSKVFIKKRF